MTNDQQHLATLYVLAQQLISLGVRSGPPQ